MLSKVYCSFANFSSQPHNPAWSLWQVLEVPKAGAVKDPRLVHRLNIFQTFMVRIPICSPRESIDGQSGRRFSAHSAKRASLSENAAVALHISNRLRS